MLKWKTHTPEGALDILEKECYIKNSIEQTIKQVFHGYGYFEIQTPTFEFYDVFADDKNNIDQTSLIKFFDKEGRVLALRPDITTPIARIAATKYSDDIFPKRVCYVGQAFREGDAHAGAIQKEFTQAGIELLGNSSPDADAEVAAVTIRSLLEAGLEEFQIDIGQVEFFKGLMEQTGLSEAEREKMHQLTDRKSFVGISELIKEYDINPDLKQLILQLPNLFGDISVIENINKDNLSPRSKKALEDLTEVYKTLCDYGYEKYISIDLGMVQGLNYYTGIIIKGFARGVGFPICGGGRYDNLIGEFGRKIPATGVAIGIERLISALNYSKVKFEEPRVDTLVCSGTHRETALKVADGLRSSGLCVEMWLGGGNAKSYAVSRGIGGIVNVVDDDKIEILNLTDDQITVTSIKDLII